jgi:hypothetical protein
MNKSAKLTTPTTETLKEPALVCSFGGALRKFPISTVVSVEPTGAIAPIPFGKIPFEGLSSGAYGITPVFNLSAHLGTTESSGKYCLILQTLKGLISIKADSVIALNANENPNHESILNAADDIEVMLTDFSGTKNSSTVTHEQMALTPTRSALILQNNSKCYAFDIEDVDFIEHHKKIECLNSFKQIVTLQNDHLINGISLSKWMHADQSLPNKELWSIGFSHEQSQSVITVENILGIESISLSLFHVIENHQEKNIWVNHPQYGAIKLLTVDEFRPDRPDLITQKIHAQIRCLPNEKTKVQKISIAKSDAGIGINLGSYGLVLPTEMISMVSNKTISSDLKKKPFKKALPTFDLTQVAHLISGENFSINDRRAITVRSPSNKNLVFLAPNIYEPSKESLWEPLPMMPKSAAKFISAIRVANGQCEMLLKSSALTDPPPSPLSKIAKTAFCGWYKAN